MRQPKKKALHRSILRDIRGSFGRFFAIFAIIALGVGFFSGVRITTPAMIHTFDTFLREHRFFDLKLASTIGWDDRDVKTVAKREQVLAAEGAIQYDTICRLPGGEDVVFKAHSITEEVNSLRLVEGRLPETDGEVVCPLKDADFEPDVVAIVDIPERIYWFEALRLRNGGGRISYVTAPFQCACEDITAYPIMKGEPNISIGCFGCRKKTDMKPDEMAIGVPYSLIPVMVSELEKYKDGVFTKAKRD